MVSGVIRSRKRIGAKKLATAVSHRLPALVLVVFAFGLAGCGYLVTTEVYKKEKEKSQAQLEFVRKQLTAHTKILANQGRAINEVRLQLREAAAKARDAERIGKGIDKSIKKAIKDSSSSESASVQRSKLKKGFPVGLSLYIRRKYRGLPLNFAGGYYTPRGKRYPYKLPPGTLVQVLSRDRRGFTRIRVKTGRWKGRKMWVRTRWLIRKTKSMGRMSGKG